MDIDLISSEQAGTLFGLLTERARRTPDGIAYRQYDRKADCWVNLTWQQVLHRTNQFAGALAEFNLPPRQNLGILLKNSVDWVCFDMAVHQLGHVVVPLYPLDSSANAAYIVRDAKVRLLFVDTASRWERIQAVADHFPKLDCVLIQQRGKSIDHSSNSLRVVSLEETLTGAPVQEADGSNGPDSPATIIYTSGTTGAPKGVVLSHRAILKNAESVARIVPPNRADVFLSILPLAHAFERTLGYYLPMMGGASTAHAQSLLRFREDLRTIRPTVMMGVPRLYEQMCSTIRLTAKGSRLKQFLIGATARIGWRHSQWRRGMSASPPPHERLIWPVLDALVAKPVSDAFGGRLRVAVSGGANLANEVAVFLVGLGVPLVEGYGLTEAGPVVTASTLEDYVPGAVGFPLPEIEVKLTGEGELLVRTPSVMKGYWQNNEATMKALLADDWLRTGDLAEFREARVYITGRCKDILVLSNGENVNPQPLESSISTDPLVEQVCIIGDGRPYLAAILVLDWALWHQQAHEWGVDPNQPNSTGSHREILERIKERLKGVPAFKQVRAIHIELEAWTIECGLMTPTMKVRRNSVLKRYEDTIEQIYRRHR